jgi:cytochrome c biogenesis protein CcdA
MNDRKSASKPDIELELMKFQVSLGEAWFKWVGWSIALGLLRYASTTSEEVVVTAAYWASHFVLIFYFLGFSAVQVDRFISHKSSWWKSITIVLISVIGTFIVAFAAVHVAHAITEIEAGSPT